MKFAPAQRDTENTAAVRNRPQRSRLATANGPCRPLTLDGPGAPPLRLGSLFAQRASGRLALQAKLTVNQPGDQFEQEADRVAEQVMRKPDSTLSLQRKCSCGGSPGPGESCEECASSPVRLQRSPTPEDKFGPATAPSVVNDVLRAPGQALDQNTRAFFERRLQRDFSDVRVHTDEPASQSARDLNALAYTVGRDVVFRSDQYAPATDSGRRLLAHELAHVIQQEGGGHKPVREAPTLQRYPHGPGLLGDFTLRPPELPSLRPGSIPEAFVIAPPVPARDTQLQLPSSLGTPAGPSFNILNERLQAPTGLPIIIQIPACVPAQPLTWADFQGAAPAGSSHFAETFFHHEVFDVQGNPMVRAIFDPGSSWVRPGSANPTDRSQSGCDTQISDCRQFLQGSPGGTWNLTPPAARTCAASPVVDTSIVANSVGDCDSVIARECDRVRIEDSPRLLRHEQLHFDIACVIARKGNLALRRLPPNQAPRIRLAVENTTNTQTSNYDTQTAHGCNAGAQARWEALVAAGLSAVRIS